MNSILSDDDSFSKENYPNSYDKDEESASLQECCKKKNNAFLIHPEPKTGRGAKEALYALREDLRNLGCRYSKSIPYKGTISPASSKEVVVKFLKEKKVSFSLQEIHDAYWEKSKSLQKVDGIWDDAVQMEERLEEERKAIDIDETRLNKEIRKRELDEASPEVVEKRAEIQERKKNYVEQRREVDQLRNSARLHEEKASHPTTGLPSGYFFDRSTGNLMYQEEASGDNEPPQPIFICSKLEVIACTRDEANKNHGRLLQFSDVDNHLKKWAMPMKMLAGAGLEYREALLDSGLLIAAGTKARNLLARYLQLSIPDARVRCVSRTGWYKDCFVLPNKIIGDQGQERMILQSESLNLPAFESGGTLDSWKENVSKFCVNNSRLAFSVSAGFAAPLLSSCEIENGGIHFRGSSSIGKSTAIQVANSVWGPQSLIQTWRATINGLEAVAYSHNDAILCLDEISQADPHSVGQSAYLLANGCKKGRADQQGFMRKQGSWRLLFLSNGEKSLSAHMAEVGKKALAGQEVRILDVPSEVGPFGIFEDLHGYENGKVFADALKGTCNRHYGSAINEFLEKFLAKKLDSTAIVKQNISKFLKDVLQPGAEGQVYRAATRFGLIAAAGELATSFGITGWPSEEATRAAKSCFQAWISARGGYGSHEEQAIISQVKRFFELHGAVRFANWGGDSETDKTVNRCGYRKLELGETEFLVFPESFKNDLAAGFDPGRVAEVCIQHGMMKSCSERDKTHSLRPPGMRSTVRFYLFTEAVLGGEK